MATKRNQRRLGRPRKLKPELHSETFCVRCTPSEIKRLGKAAAAAAQPPSAWAREKLMMMVVGVLSRSTKEAGRKGKGPRESVLNKAWTLMVESVLARERLLRAGVRAAVESVAIAAVSRRRRRKSKARLPAKHARTEHFCMALRWIQHTMVLEAADVRRWCTNQGEGGIVAVCA